MCPFYGEGGKIPDFKKELFIDEIKVVIDDIKRSYKYYPYKPYIGIIGGEPFIHPNIFEVLAYLKENGFKYAITTNLVLLNDDKIKKLLTVGVNDLRVSLDGPEEVHDLIRNIPGTFNKVQNNLKRIRSDRKGKKIPIRFNCVICPQNVKYLADMPAIAKEFNADLSFQHLMFIDEKHNKLNMDVSKKLFGEQLHMDATSLRLTKEHVEIAKINVMKMLDNAKKLNVNISFTPNLNIKEFNDYYFNLDNYTHSNDCNWPWGSVRISPNGDLSGCIYKYGNLRNESFTHIWYGKRANLFRQKLKDSKLFPSCIRCCKI